MKIDEDCIVIDDDWLRLIKIALIIHCNWWVLMKIDEDCINNSL
jgi:hypothetical protein